VVVAGRATTNEINLPRDWLNIVCEKTLRELKQELTQLEIAIRLAGDRESRRARRREMTGPGPTRQIATAIWSERVPASIPRRVRHALAKLRGPGGWEAPDYRERVFAALRDVATAWGGKCVSAAYDGHKQPLDFECADGHHFPMLIHMVRNGSWCQACAYERATIHSLDEAHKLAARRGGERLSTHYDNLRSKLMWRCAGMSGPPVLGEHSGAIGARHATSHASGRSRK
jgi:hypothetical protein